jgi:copper chaperone CopZ
MNMLKKQIVNIEGMMCEGCARTVTNILEKLPGVKKVKVSYQKGIAEGKAEAPLSEEEY